MAEINNNNNRQWNRRSCRHIAHDCRAAPNNVMEIDENLAKSKQKRQTITKIESNAWESCIAALLDISLSPLSNGQRCMSSCGLRTGQMLSEHHWARCRTRHVFRMSASESVQQLINCSSDSRHAKYFGIFRLHFNSSIKSSGVVCMCDYTNCDN